MTFGEKLKRLLEEHDITQRALANQLGMQPSTLGNYIQDTREPDFATLKQFAAYFKVSTDYLLSYTLSPNEAEDEDEIIRIYRELKPKYRHLLIEQGKLLIKIEP